MPEVILKILAVLGVLLLILLGAVLLLLLLVLFVPVTYKVKGVKNSEKAELSARARWMFGLLRVRYAYPEPGRLTVKILWFTLLGAEKKGRKPKKKSKEDTADADKKAGEADKKAAKPDKKTTEANEKATGPDKKDAEEIAGEEYVQDESRQETAAAPADNPQPDAAFEGNFFEKKISRIKYTIRNICDKIKMIWENMEYYASLLRDEETKQLFSQVCFRLGKIMKHFLPRKIRADVLYGMDSPDITGYLFGGYAILLPMLGPSVTVTPDFTRKVLEGNLFLSGHVTVFHMVRILLDRDLKKLIKKLKAGRK